MMLSQKNSNNKSQMNEIMKVLEASDKEKEIQIDMIKAGAQQQSQELQNMM